MPAVVLDLSRDMRSSEELLSESSLRFFLRLRTGFCFVTGAFFSISESLESNDGTFLAAGALDAGLGLERASKIDGCFTSREKEKKKNDIPKINLLISLFYNDHVLKSTCDLYKTKQTSVLPAAFFLDAAGFLAAAGFFGAASLVLR